MTLDIKKGTVVEYPIGDETGWFRIMGDHNSGGLQGRLETPLDSAVIKIGEYARLELQKILRTLPDDRD